MKSERSFISATWRHPCPICKRPGWCSIADDRSIAICMRVFAGSVSKTKNGGFLHVLCGNGNSLLIEPPPKSNATNIEQRHQVYTALLDILPLSGNHADHLMFDRGLSDTTIVRNGYATWPIDEDHRRQICRELSSSFNLDGVPGFYKKDNEWRMVGQNWSGFLIASRNARGLITALTIRFDDATDGKYQWFSSGGVLSPQPHIVRPWRVNTDPEAILTVGVLKSDIIGELIDCTVIGLPWTASFSCDLGEQIRAELPKVENIHIAYDADFQTKPQVQLSRLSEVLLNAGLGVHRLIWPIEAGKGLDDFLLGKEAR